MQNSYIEHPAEEALERFLLSQCSEDELETVETHVLACESCVSRLEALESDIAAMKTALRELERERVVAAAAASAPSRSWKNWFSVPNLAWAAAAAVLVLGVSIAPRLTQHPGLAPADVTLSAFRGNETPVAPEKRPLHVHFAALHLPSGPVSVELVDANTGSALWTGSGSIQNDQLTVTTPAIAGPGAYLFRLYAPGHTDRDLLREFSLQTK